MTLLLDLMLLAVMLLAIYGLGCAVRRITPFEFWGAASDLAFTMAFGLGLIAVLLFVLALLGFLHPLAGWLILIIGCLLALIQWQAVRQMTHSVLDVAHSLATSSWFVRLFALIGVTFVLMNLIGDLAPPLEGDTVHQYLLTPREWVAAGRYTQPANIWASTLPGNMMMISAWALLLRSSYSLATLITGFGLSLCFGISVYALARLYLERTPAALAGVAAYTMPDVGYLAQSAKVDMGWALFEVLALAAVFRWMDLYEQASAEAKAGTFKWLALAGVCLGLAAGSKNQTFISIVLLGVWIVLRLILRGDRRDMIRVIGVFAVSVLAAGFPYYLYNALTYRNPFYPVFADIFAHWFGGTPSPRSELGTEIFYPWTVGGYLANLWNMSLGHGPDFYLGFIAGPILLLVLPIGLLLGLMRGQRPLWRMLGYAFVFSIVWFLVKQAARHFLPGLVLLSVVSGYLLWQIDLAAIPTRRIIQTAAVLVLLGNLAVWAGVFYWHQSFRVALGIETREQFLQRVHDHVLGARMPDSATLTVLNTQLNSTDRILTNSAASPLYITPQLVSGNWGDRLSYERIDNPEMLLAELSSHGIEYVLVYNIDTNPPLFASDEFLLAHAELIYDGPRTRLYHLVSGEGD